MNRAAIKTQAKKELGGLFSNNWLIAVVFSLILTGLGGAGTIMEIPHLTDQIITYTRQAQTGEIPFGFNVSVSAVTPFSSILNIAAIIISPAIMIGVYRALLLMHREGAQLELRHLGYGFSEVFSGALGVYVLQTIFTVLWTLLFIIPGIIKGLGYSMAMFVKIDHPELGARDCLRRSEEIMKGHKGELFVLYLSFIGWYIVGALCFGVGTLWVEAYEYASLALFYDALVMNERSAPGYVDDAFIGGGYDN